MELNSKKVKINKIMFNYFNTINIFLKYKILSKSII